MTWIDWGPGEELDDPRNRKDWGLLLMRFIVCHPAWDNSSVKAAQTPHGGEPLGLNLNWLSARKAP